MMPPIQREPERGKCICPCDCECRHEQEPCERPCPACDSNDVTDIYGTTSWLMGWSPVKIDGVLHYHDPNRRHDELQCRACGCVWQHTWFIPCNRCSYIAGPDKILVLNLKAVPGN